MKLSVKSFALSCGIIWGLGILFITYWLLIFGATGTTIEKLGKIYLGYSYSWVGGIVGLLWGFLYGLICGAVFAWLYNRLSLTKSRE
jgi:hypothetical protein